MLTGIKETAKAVGISVHELRTGAIAGRYPFLSCGNKRMFDVEEVKAVIRQRMYDNQKGARECSMS